MINITVWRKNYDKVQEISKLLKCSKEGQDGSPPKARLSLNSKKSLEAEIGKLLEETSLYLDICNVKFTSYRGNK